MENERRIVLEGQARLLRGIISNGATSIDFLTSLVNVIDNEIKETHDVSNVENQVKQITLTNNGEQTKMRLTLSNGEETEDKIVVTKNSNVSNVDSEDKVNMAANAYGQKIISGDLIIDGIKQDYPIEQLSQIFGLMFFAFKSGAEWQKKQLQK